jgi:hypothetical protein
LRCALAMSGLEWTDLAGRSCAKGKSLISDWGWDQAV